MHFTRESLGQLDKRYRTQLINSLSGFKSANLIGTSDKTGQTNLAIVSSVFHLGANPPLMGLIFRPHSVPRHSLQNILETGIFTINQVSEKIYRQAHQSSAKYTQEQSEFNEVGLEAAYLADFKAPFVAESSVKIGLSLVENQTLAVNNTELVIGEIKHIFVPENAIKADGYLDIEGLETVALSGLDSYHVTHRMERLSYAKPNQTLSQLTINGEFSRIHKVG
ncbi:flavin reductase [Catenovulum sp. SM1970]|uniref:flavin reductase family protein n=1 Tax=Marinifaba aquimaris TaxID=2741323 RepID=UPI0015746544|nr:flavin reductase family protein [Marinifaba aquimaris]NTS76485.1 flavin reductase [Marinifaba aquimaris]